MAALVLAIAAAGAMGLAAWWRPEPRPAPAITVVTIEGKRVALQELRGKVVLVNFWATSCVPCRREMPDMVATYRSYRDRGLEAVFIAMPYDRPDHVLAYARAHALPFPVALDVMGEATRAFGDVSTTPTAFVLDKRGRIVERFRGMPDFERLHALIERELAAPA